MGRDYRIGLVAGSILAGVALLWVATRPSLSPQPPPVQAPQGKDQDPPAAGPRVAFLGPASPSEADKPAGQTEIREPQTPDEPTGQSLLPNPSARVPEPARREKTEPGKTTRFHVVRQGETLSAIAQQYYGSTSQWRKILTANEKAIKDANKIAPGTKLVIP